jgi:hypothetical protein
MKRSTQIGLVVAGALGVTSASGYYLTHRNEACRQNPGRTDQDCRHSSSGHGSGRPLFGTSSTSQTSTTSSPSSPSTSAERGGFGSTGRAIGLFSSAS